MENLAVQTRLLGAAVSNPLGKERDYAVSVLVFWVALVGKVRAYAQPMYWCFG